MTKDEKIAYYNKIEKALNIEYPVMHEGMTETQIRSLVSSLAGEEVTVDDLEPLVIGPSVSKEIANATFVGNLYGSNNIAYKGTDNTWDVYDRELDKKGVLKLYYQDDTTTLINFKMFYSSLTDIFAWVIFGDNGDYKIGIAVKTGLYKYKIIKEIVPQNTHIDLEFLYVADQTYTSISSDGKQFMLAGMDGLSNSYNVFLFTIDTDYNILQTSKTYSFSFTDSNKASACAYMDALNNDLTKVIYMANNELQRLYCIPYEDSNTTSTVDDGRIYTFQELNITEDKITNIRGRGLYLWVVTDSNIYIYQKNYLNLKKNTRNI